MLWIAICDDDIIMRSYLSEQVAQVLPDSRVEEYSDGKGLLQSMKDFDILLMDIKMEKMDGLQVIRKIREQSEEKMVCRPIVIFITAYDEHVFEAFDLFAFQYLTKPLDEKKFARTLKLAAMECTQKAREKALFFHTKNQNKRFYPSEIWYVESYLRKAVIHTKTEEFEIYSTMGKLEEMLGKGFFRCHRGYLVNLEKICGYNRRYIQLQDGTELLMAKPKYQEFINTYMYFLQRKELEENG